jgi:DNA repair exonuclease SbcCD ATPase subunit
MAQLDDRLAALQQQIDQRSREVAQYQAQQDLLKSQLEQELATLKSEFNVSSLPEAKMLLTDLERNLQETLESAESELRRLAGV